MVRISHAATSNTNKPAQVTIRNWYSNSWNYVLRPKDKNIAEKIAQAAVDGANNDYIYYSQARRNELKARAQIVGFDLKRIVVDTACDCSSFATVCCECAGITIPYTSGYNAPTTSTMKTVFTNTGYFNILTDSKYLTSDKYLKKGDLLVKTGVHTVIVIDNGELSNDEEIKAIDLSKYNTIKDYSKLAQQIKYCFVRAGFRSYSSGVITEDTLFKTHISNLLKYGVKCGLYFYDQSLNEQEAIQEAEWCVAIAKQYKIELPIAIDSEYSNPNHNGRADNISKSQRTKNVLAFYKRVKELGYEPCIYCSDSWATSMLEYNQIKDCYLWIARYSTQAPKNPCNIWQYGSQVFNFAPGAIDVNIIYNLPSNTNTSLPEPKTSINEAINNVVNANALNVRELPNTNAIVVKTLKKGDKVDIYAYSNGWVCINTTLNQWVNAKYIDSIMGTISANTLNIRSGAGTTYPIIGQLKKDMKVKVLNKVGTWYTILYNNVYGFVSENYVNI